MVTIQGYVYDTEGRAVNDASVGAFSLTTPRMLYARVNTDAKGRYSLVLERPKRLDFPVEDFGTGRPVREGYWVRVRPLDATWKWLPIECVIDVEKKETMVKDFILRAAGALKLKAYTSTGSLITAFPPPNAAENPTRPVYVTDLDWRVIPSQFLPDPGIVILPVNIAGVINFPWEVPGFGKVIVRADNGSRGFTLKTQGATATIMLNYELAGTELRLLRESYEQYLSEGYCFSSDSIAKIHYAEELFEKADSIKDDRQRAHLADACLNQTLWVAEDLEVEKARQSIERHRKGSVVLAVVDENGNPVKGIEVAVTQVTHDFLFGILAKGARGVRDYSQALEIFRTAGINCGLLQLYWRETEPRLGQLEYPYSVQSLGSLRGIGIHFGAEGLICLEPPNTWDLGVLDLGFEELKAKTYEHVYKLAAHYSEHLDYWIVAHNAHKSETSLGFTWKESTELLKAGIAAIKTADPTSQVLVYLDDPCGWDTAEFLQLTYDGHTVDPYTYLLRISQQGIDFGIAIAVNYNSVFEPGGETEIKLRGAQGSKPFRDLASISRLLDWYGRLGKPIHITEFFVPGDFKSRLGYWHRAAWDESLKKEWIQKFYTIAFSKPAMKQINYWVPVDKPYQRAKSGLLDSNYAPRDSFYALKRLITEDWTTRLSLKTDANGKAEFGGFAGDYKITVRAKDLTADMAIHVQEQTNQTMLINLGELKASQARETADRAISWLFIPAVIASVSVALFIVILRRRISKK